MSLSKTAILRESNITTEIFGDGNRFTMVTISSTHNGIKFYGIGLAERSPNDKHRAMDGFKYAFDKAIESAKRDYQGKHRPKARRKRCSESRQARWLNKQAEKFECDFVSTIAYMTKKYAAMQKPQRSTKDAS